MHHGRETTVFPFSSLCLCQPLLSSLILRRLSYQPDTSTQSTARSAISVDVHGSARVLEQQQHYTGLQFSSRVENKSFCS